MLAVSAYAIALFYSSVQAGVAPVLKRDDFHGFPVGDVCQFEGGGPVGVSNAVCAGSDGKPHTDKITCPDQGVADRICGRDDENEYVRDNCKVIDGSGTYCTTNKVPTDDYEYYNRCYCVNGNFCCDQNAEVPGGESPIDYFKGAGCSCGDPI